MKRSRPRLYDRPPAWPALLTRELVCAYLGDISRQLLSRWRASAGFPEPLRLAGVQRWSRAAIDRWIALHSPPPDRAPARSAAPSKPSRRIERALMSLLDG